MERITSQNLSLFTVPAAFVMCLVPGVWAVALSKTSYDLAYPRRLVATTAQKISRARAASDNGFETLGFYAAAVVAANHANVDTPLLNLVTLAYVASRIAYVFVYVQLGNRRSLAPLRSLVWTAGTILTMTLYIKAGLRMLHEPSRG